MQSNVSIDATIAIVIATIQTLGFVNAVKSGKTTIALNSSAVVGTGSETKYLDVISFDSDTPMHEAMFDRLETVGREVSFLNMHQKIDGPEFMRQLMEGFHTNYPSFIRQLRKLEAKKCYYCKKTPPKLSYCSVCRYVRYCSSECQHADWKIHKHECKFMVTNSIFFNSGKRIK